MWMFWAPSYLHLRPWSGLGLRIKWHWVCKLKVLAPVAKLAWEEQGSRFQLCFINSEWVLTCQTYLSEWWTSLKLKYFGLKYLLEGKVKMFLGTSFGTRSSYVWLCFVLYSINHFASFIYSLYIFKNLFKVYNSVVFSIFIELYNYHKQSINGIWNIERNWMNFSMLLMHSVMVM